MEGGSHQAWEKWLFTYYHLFQWDILPCPPFFFNFFFHFFFFSSAKIAKVGLGINYLRLITYSITLKRKTGPLALIDKNQTERA